MSGSGGYFIKVVVGTNHCQPLWAHPWVVTYTTTDNQILEPPLVTVIMYELNSSPVLVTVFRCFLSSVKT